MGGVTFQIVQIFNTYFVYWAGQGVIFIVDGLYIVCIPYNAGRLLI